MYQKRFPGEDIADKSIEQIRGMEGQRVRALYAKLATEHGVEWTGRDYDQDNWFQATPVNRASRRPTRVCTASATRPLSRPAIRRARLHPYRASC